MARTNDVACKFIQDYHLTHEDVEKIREEWQLGTRPMSLQLRALFDLVDQLSPEIMGEICFEGPSVGSEDAKGWEIYTIHCGTYIDKYSSGSEMLKKLTATSVLPLT